MQEGLIIIILGVLGLCFGSFANAAVWRLKVRKDITKDRSECIHCHHKLGAADLIPIISWLMLRGKCRYCKKPISVQYPLVEAALTLYFVGSYLVWPSELISVYAWIDFGLWLSYGVGLAILFVYDLRWYLLPDKVVWPLVVLGAADFINTSLWQGWTGVGFLAGLALAVLAIAGFYYVLHAVSGGKWIGFGDVKLGLFMGLALGWPLALLCLFLANFIGCLVIIPGLVSGRLKPDSRIPFGPFLIVAFILTGLWGNALMAWGSGFFNIGL